MLEKYLEDLGLSDKEAKVYTALLQVDGDSVLDLSKRTNINRTTIYPVLDSLATKGLISEVKKNRKVSYQAEPPERLETFIERQKIVLDERSRRLQDIIPQLKSIQREQGERPVVKYFEGASGVMSSVEEFFSYYEENKGTNYIVYSRDLIDSTFGVQREEFSRRRKNKGIKVKSIYTRVDGDVEGDNQSKRIRIDEKKYPIMCDIGIYNENVRISILGSQVSAIMIKSKDLAITLRSLIDLIYDLKNNQK